MTDYVAEGEKKKKKRIPTYATTTCRTQLFYRVYDFGTCIFHIFSLCSNNIKVNVGIVISPIKWLRCAPHMVRL